MVTSAMMSSEPEGIQDALAFFESREEFQQSKAELEAAMARQRQMDGTDSMPDLVLAFDAAAHTANDPESFNVAAGIADFLDELGFGAGAQVAVPELGAYADSSSGQDNAVDSRVSREELVSLADLELLSSVRDGAGKKSSRYAAHQDTPAQLKARLLDTVARLALHPALTVPVARCFSPILLDIAARWLMLLSHDGQRGFSAQADQIDKRLVVRVLTALTRLLATSPSLYPMLLVLLRHPHLQTPTPFTLLSDLPANFSPPGLPSSALQPSDDASPLIYHPELPALLLTLHTLIELVPHFPLIPTVLHNYGGPIPPLLLRDVMSSHPYVSMRTLAWQITCLWLGWTGPSKEDLRRQFVYDPDKDTENGKDGTVVQIVPFPDLSKPKGQGEEWLEGWPRLVGSRPRVDATGKATFQVESAYIDAWIYESESSKMARAAWRLPFRRPSEEAIPETSSMDLDPAAVTRLVFTDEDLTPLVTCVQGIYTLRESCLPDSSILLSASTQGLPHPQVDTVQVPRLSTFVPSAPAVRALRQLASLTAARAPILLSSPPSAGKACVLEELHRILHTRAGGVQTPRDRQIVTINLADRSLDAKTLLGSLSSSPTEPGTFVFVEGSLTRAIRHGRWLVLEDIDRAADDVLCTVAELVERIRNRRESFVGGAWGGAGENGVGVSAGGQWVPAAEGFMLFATRSVQSASSDSTHAQHPSATFLGNQYWTNVWLDLPTLEETRRIVQGRFTRLSEGMIARLVEVWDAVKHVANGATGSSGTGMSRDVGIRDLVKWCERVQRRLPRDLDITSIEQNPVLQEEVFIEARDVFLGAFPPASAPAPTSMASGASTSEQPRRPAASASTKYLAIVAALRDGLALSAERVEWMLAGRTPEITATQDADVAGSVQIGRATLQKLARKRATIDRKPYALTKPFLVLLEKLAVSTQLAEPVLMVGETGTGKTAAVGYMAERLGRNLVALNLSNQTEASDLLGGFKPVNEAEEMERTALDLVNEFVELFSRTFSLARNAEYTAAVTKAFKKKKWARLVGLWREAARMASDRITALRAAADASIEDSPRKKRKTSTNDIASAWQTFLADVAQFEQRQVGQDAKAAKFAFAFVEGPLVKAIQRGDWVLLDEVNLATPETLESLSTLLQHSDASLVLTERGDLEPVRRHPDFRLFACMNPATDVGKRDLPPALRAKFTEIYVPPPDADREALLSIVQGYIGHVAVGDRGIVLDVAEFYLAIKALALAGKLADGTNQPPHFSMRTLARALTFAADLSSTFGIRRAVYEGCVMAFTTLLEGSSADTVLELMQKHFVERAKNPRSFLSAVPTKPPASTADSYVQLSSFWLAKGSLPVDSSAEYVLTASVQTKLVNLARAVAISRFPVLIQGPTSSGKTSIIEYLASQTGHRFVRINNHEHTDIQEYLGTYVSDPQTGKLVFREGILVKAVRNGDWIVLDELNLAPTDVLEALNRLLDDNRELVIPETQEVVKPHPHFMLFATQNPPGLYGGRKVLSRAFRNRFLEMHFSDVPKDELERILCERCKIAPSYAKKIVAVFLELQKRRQSTRVFEEKQAFVTLRDLFRWGGREAVGYEQLAADGYMLLAERARKLEDKEVVKEVIETTMKVKLDERELYQTAFSQYVGSTQAPSSELVWTSAMRRLYVLVRSALQHNEPVLLVGETGSGKTSVCQSIADALNCALHIVNCHQNTETADLIGSQRPIRNRSSVQEGLRAEAVQLLATAGSMFNDDDATFEDLMKQVDSLSRSSSPAKILLQKMKEASALFLWHDGPLVQAMKHGDLVLLDEISLADDSVLERLNSVLESGRTLVVAEKGAENLEDVRIVGHERFKVLATMNPGGDYGKKELSPALRNRFTEIWVPWVTDTQDLTDIINGRWASPSLQAFTPLLLDFSSWFTRAVRPRDPPAFGSVVTLRDVLAWVAFMNVYTEDSREGFVHGALLTLVDSIGSTSATSGLMPAAVTALRRDSVGELVRLAGLASTAIDHFTIHTPSFASTATHFTIAPFAVEKSRATDSAGTSNDFSLLAPTTLFNARKVMRALQLPKPILLEGSPGVGKTSLVTALARLANFHLCRINLSDQTDLIDLFGSDLPVEGGKSGEFAWRDAPFLAAMQAGDWVLLDEMNLASQSVLEGLNSCLDHRGSVYIPELDRSFVRHPNFRIFAAQNPSNQGGSRKGLPRSFVDRFTQVYMDELQQHDYSAICKALYSNAADEETVERMVSFVTQLNALTTSSSRFAQQGAPWEVNLRDLLRWFQLLLHPAGLERSPGHPVEYLDILFLQRFRTDADREQVIALFQDLFGLSVPHDRAGRPAITPRAARIGSTPVIRRDTLASIPASDPTQFQQSQLRPLQTLAASLQANLLAIVTGPQGSGKTSVVHQYAALVGQRVQSFHMNPQTDTLEMLGTFEQSNLTRLRLSALARIKSCLQDFATSTASRAELAATHAAFRQLATVASSCTSPASTAGAGLQGEVALFRKHCSSLILSQDAFHAFDLLQDSIASATLPGRFEWIDGPLVRAMKSGDIFVIENANLCNASVLDRLNGLFEPNGKLLLAERGAVDNAIVTVEAHPDFRVVMALDPRHGELSRAMRNRGVEIALQKPSATIQRTPFSSASLVVAPSSSASSGAGPAAEGSGNTAAALATSADTAVLACSAESLGALARRAPDTRLERFHGMSFLAPRLRVRSAYISSVGSLGAIKPILFSLDSNDARKAVPVAARSHLLAIDGVAKCLLRTLSGQQALALRSRTAVEGRTSKHSIGELSCINAAHPSRLQRLEIGVASIFPLQQSIYETTISCASALQASPENDIALAQAVTSLEALAFELEHVAAQEHLDYATYQTILSWLQETLDGAPFAVLDKSHSLHAALTHAKTAVRRTSGHNFEKIWTHFLPAKLAAPLRHKVKHIEQLATECSLSSIPTELAVLFYEIRNAAQTASTAEQVASISAVLDKLATKLADTAAAAKDPNERVDMHLIVSLAETHALARTASSSDGNSTTFLSIASASERTLASLQPYFARNQSKMLAEWVKHLCFEAGDSSRAHLPADLLSSSLLADVLSTRATSISLPLSLHAQAMQQIKSGGQAHFELATLSGPSRLQCMTELLLHLVSELLAAIGRAVPGTAGETLATKLETVSAVLVDNDSTTSALRSSLAQLSEALARNSDTSKPLASAYLHFANYFWISFLPNIPLDPSVATQAKEAFLARQKGRLLAAAASNASLVRDQAGGTGTIELDVLAGQLIGISSELSQLEESVTRRKGAGGQAILAALFTELGQASGSLFGSSQVVKALLNSTEYTDSMASQIQNVQDAVSSIVGRLLRAYAAYGDITEPLLLCLGTFSIGLGLYSHTIQKHRAGKAGAVHEQALAHLTAYPSLPAAAPLLAMHIPSSLKTEAKPITSPSQLARLHLSSIVFTTHATPASLKLLPDSTAAAHLHRTYEQIFHLWAIDQKRAEEAKAEAESIYKSRKQEVIIPADDDLEAAELAELFPTYEDEDSGPRASIKISSATSVPKLFSQDDVLSMYTLHQRLFMPGEDTSLPDYSHLRESLVRQITQAFPHQLSESIDAGSVVYQLDNLVETLNGSDKTTRHFDFYQDGSLEEIRKLEPVAASMLARVNALIEEWPDQMVLMDIQERCLALLSVPSTTPIAKMLTYLDALLSKIEDWENYASKETSLRSFQSQYIEIIVSWRRLELYSWARLLEVQEAKFCEPVADWWFRFYETAVRAAVAMQADGATTADEAQQYLHTLVGLLETFFSASPIGQFSKRLDLVLSFARLCKVVAASTSTLVSHVSAILFNVHQFYSRKGAEMLNHLAAERKNLEREVQDVLRLASWKDVNIYALRQSAQKSHRQLHKIVRKLRALLDKPASNFLNTTTRQSGQIQNSTTVSLPIALPMRELAALPATLPALPEGTPAAIVHLDVTVDRLRTILTKQNVELAAAATRTVDDLTSTIIDRADTLRKEEAKGDSKEAIAKAVGAVTDRKRKALSDLLKELKRIGLSPRPAPSTLARQQNSAQLYETPPLVAAEPDDLLMATIESINTYFYRNLGRLPSLRQTPSMHHEDISSHNFQTAVGSIQSCFALIVDDRRLLQVAMDHHAKAAKFASTAAAVLESGLATQQNSISLDRVDAILHATYQLQHVLRECEATARRHVLLAKHVSDAEGLKSLASAVSSIENALPARLQALECAREQLSGCQFTSLRSAESLIAAQGAWVEVCSDLDAILSSHPRLAYLLEPVIAWTSTTWASIVHDERSAAADEKSPAESVVAHAALIGSLLVVIQGVDGEAPAPVAKEDDDFDDAGLKQAAMHMQQKLVRFRLPDVMDHLQAFMRSCGPNTSTASEILLARVMPVLQAYLSLLEQHIFAYFAWHRSLLKFCHVLVGLMLTLADEGFCKPSEGETQSGGEGQTSEGTGMGAGKGDKNVSNEIEGEEQVEGLQDQDDQDEDDKQPEQQDKKDDAAVDMTDDFGGRTEDVPEDENDEQDGDQDEEDGEEDDVQEEVGKVDPLDPGAVDDKFWGGDDKKEEPEETDEQTDQQAEQSGDPEMGTRQDDKPPKKEEKKKEDQVGDNDIDANGDQTEKEEESADEQADAPEDMEVQPEHEPGEDENGEQVEDRERQEMPNLDNETQALDLPDDLQLDAQPDKENEQEDEEDLAMDGELEGPDGDRDDNDDGMSEGAGNEEDKQEVAGSPQPQADGDQPDTEEEEAMQHTSGGDAGTSGGDAPSASTLPTEDEKREKDGDQDETPGDMEMDAPSGQAGQADAGKAGRRERARQQDRSASGRSEAMPDANTSNSQEIQQAENKASEDADDQEGGDTVQPEEQRRDLGDASKAWMRRLEAIPDALETSDQTNAKEDTLIDDTKDIEYTQNADEDVTLQASGAADEEDAKQAGQQMDENRMVDDFEAMEVEEMVNPSLQDRTQVHQIPDKAMQDDKDQDEERGGPDSEKEEERRKRLEEMDEDSSGRQREPTPDEEEEDLDAPAISQQLQHWYEEGRSSLPSDEVWRLYESLTRDLSFSLTESLRLILEPTLATRLKGDYRTGKRLNMKKIIPYIASDFTKDKIWLRRTRPSQREYQILLSLDDSRSMSDSHSVHLAYQTLALVCQSLTRLEVGEISVCRFGETVDFIHRFEDGPVSDVIGTKIVDAFTFGQRSTDVRRLLERSLERLSAARENRRGSSTDLWQLEIIISDGICQDLDDLRALLRKATEQKVMVVFVVVDSLHQQPQSVAKDNTAGAAIQKKRNTNSILSMNSVSYVRGKDGNLELQMERYMDAFPFDYYVVLRDVESLPDVLSETLRQFFERVAGDR